MESSAPLAPPRQSNGRRGHSLLISLLPHPGLAASLALREGVSAQGLHVTLLRGRVTPNLSAVQALIAPLVAGTAPIEARLSGVARLSGREMDSVAALVDGAGILPLRQGLQGLLAEAADLELRGQGYLPHLTLRRVGRQEAVTLRRFAEMSTVFTQLQVRVGQQGSLLTLSRQGT